MKYYLYKDSKVIATLTKPTQATINELISYGYSILITNSKPVDDNHNHNHESLYTPWPDQLEPYPCPASLHDKPTE